MSKLQGNQGEELYLCPGAAKTKYHQLGVLNSRHYGLTILEAGSLRSQCSYVIVG